LLRASDVPVLLLKTFEPYRRPVVMAAVDPSHTHAKPLDLDSRILAEARYVTAAMRGSLHVIHVNAPPLHGLAYGEPIAGAEATARAYGELEKRGREDFAKLLIGSSIAEQRCHLVGGTPADALPRFARKLDAGLVVMGAVSRSGLARVFIGNTAERVLGELPCDVLVVKPKRFERRVPRKRSGAIVLTHAPTTAVAH
jgi:universal stress protein E